MTPTPPQNANAGIGTPVSTSWSPVEVDVGPFGDSGALPVSPPSWRRFAQCRAKLTGSENTLTVSKRSGHGLRRQGRLLTEAPIVRQLRSRPRRWQDKAAANLRFGPNPH